MTSGVSVIKIVFADEPADEPGDGPADEPEDGTDEPGRSRRGAK